MQESAKVGDGECPEGGIFTTALRQRGFPAFHTWAGGRDRRGKPWDEKPLAQPLRHPFRKPREDQAVEERRGKTAGVQTRFVWNTSEGGEEREVHGTWTQHSGQTQEERKP